MAESKRNSVAGKVATPKAAGTPTTPSASPTDIMQALGKSIGARIKLTTAAPDSQTHEGSLFTACPNLNIVIINTRNAPSNQPASTNMQPGDYRVINLSRIQSFQVLSLRSAADNGSNTFASAQPSIGPVDVKRLEERERAKINKLKEDDRNKGKGVTKEAQAIFDSLKRINMPIRWHNDSMIVHDAVIISSPYRPEDCKGPKERQEVLIRVRKVLEGERKKLKEKEERDRKAAVPIEPRKGG